MASFSKKLCHAVEKRKVLYDRSIQSRVKRTHIENAWQAVAVECNESIHSVKTRWRNIRKVLLRFVSKGNTTAQMRKTRSKDYYLYDELQFLLPHLANIGPDDLGDSDMEFGVNAADLCKERTPDSVRDMNDDSNDALSTLSASENSSMSGIGVAGSATAEKRKRESRTSTTSNKTSSVKSDDKSTSFEISETPSDGSSAASRIRRVQNKVQIQSPVKADADADDEEENKLKEKPEEQQKKNGESLLRTRSKSLYLERPSFEESSADSDDDYNPPAPKRAAIKDDKSASPAAASTILTRTKAAKKPKATEIKTAEDTADETKDAKPSDADVDGAGGVHGGGDVDGAGGVHGDGAGGVHGDGAGGVHGDGADDSKVEVEVKAESMNKYKTSTIIAKTTNDDEDNRDFPGIDMTLLAAAAEAEAAAERGETEIADDADPGSSSSTANIEHVISSHPPVINADASVQCDLAIDEEDDEFMQRLRKWLLLMTQRQKILFRRGIYQAYIDVYDDPREFPPQKSADKFPQTAQGLPAIFSGMTPVELRLVRHLAMAVTGHKITASSSPFAFQDNKSQVSSMRIEPGTKLPTVPANASASSASASSSGPGSRSPPERNTGNGNNQSGVVRTTAIALTNHSGRTGNNMPRILRKVVRVGGSSQNPGAHGTSNSGGGGGGGGGGGAGSNMVQSTNTLLQRTNSGVMRSRLVTSSAMNTSGTPGTEKQRVYRILPNGIVARQNPNSASSAAGSSINNPNSSNSPTSFSQSFAMLCSSNSSAHPGGGGKNVTQYRQILPKLSQVASSGGSVSQTNVSLNGEQKLSGISIRRHVQVGSGSGGSASASGSGSGPTSASGMGGTAMDNRTQMARRYSVCGSAPNNDLYTSSSSSASSSNKDDTQTGAGAAARRSMTSASTVQPQQLINVTDPSKITTRVRYAQSPGTAGGGNTMRTGTLSQKFSLPSPGGSSSSNANKSSNSALNGATQNAPIPVAMTTWHTTQSSAQEEEEQQQMKILQSMSPEDLMEQDPIAMPDETVMPNTDPTEGASLLLNSTAKQNCIIASDAFESFVIKNEPLDLEEEE